MIKLFLVSSEKKNSFGVNIVVKNLSKELKKHCLIYEDFSIFRFIFSTKNILYIHGCWRLNFFFYVIIAKITNAKIVFSPHGMLDPYSFSLKPIRKKLVWFLFQKKILKFSDLIIVNSSTEKKNIDNIFKNKKTVVISHGISNMKKNHNIRLQKNKKIRFVFFSRIHPVKNLKKLIDIWHNDNFFRNYELSIYGDIADNQYFKELNKKIYLNNNISYKGPLYKDKIKTLSKYEVFILPSVSENFGLVVLEALKAGLYLILNKNLPWKIIKKNGLGSLIKFDKKNLISTINKINRNKKIIFSKKRKTNINKFLTQNFNWKKITEKYIKELNIIQNR